MVEQNARRALTLAHRAYVLELGQNRFEGPGLALLAGPRVQALYLGRAYHRRVSWLPATYPVTEPAVRPWTRYFWKMSTRRTAGIAARKPEAAITE